ncbi:MAG: histidinol-phosphate transaminase [Bacteroidales bacterium]|jgi:histidinol-phosphate aminotransferase|nr:histidinol-phosphate transaminase [Bacteroidales bacterium]
MNLEQLVRPNIWHLKPYSSARTEFKGEASVYIDANENPYNAVWNRYPDPLQNEVKRTIAAVKGVTPDCIFLGNGSDEPIDLLYRVFCEPRTDNVVAIDPTYGMYSVAADINHVEYRKVLLDESFNFSADNLLNSTDPHTKLIFLCSPNNPTANLLNRDEIVKTIRTFSGVVVLDEAYIDFSGQSSFLSELGQYKNLIVLQTFSKAWASASVRLGMAFATPEIVQILNKVKYPYNINRLTQDYALKMLENPQRVKDWVAVLLREREQLQKRLAVLPCVEKIYPTDANFLLVKVTDADDIYRYLVERGVIVRNRSHISLCLNCLRITVGTPEENQIIISSLADYVHV